MFVIGQQDAPSCCGAENLWPHHFLAEIVREKARGGLSFDERHLLVDPRKGVWLELHQLPTFSPPILFEAFSLQCIFHGPDSDGNFDKIFPCIHVVTSFIGRFDARRTGAVSEVPIHTVINRTVISARASTSNCLRYHLNAESIDSIQDQQHSA